MGKPGDVRFFAFQQENSKNKPNEDAYYHGESNGSYFFAVADGVSRAVYGDASKPFSALPAAEAFCKKAIPALRAGEPMRRSFAIANAEIAAVNEKANITSDTTDYLGLDYLCCEGIAGMLRNEPPYHFSYGYIGDCGILVYDRNLLPLCISDNPMGVLEKFREGFVFNNKSHQRIFWRKQLRNCPDRRFMTYGALTGEASALTYLKTGSINLEPGDTVIMFSDGIYPFIFDFLFRQIIVYILQDPSSVTVNWILDGYIQRACQKLHKQKIGNLDDDKTFIALTVD